MIQYLIKRLLLMIPTLLGITIITFFIMKLAPGDPVSLKLMFAKEGISAKALEAELAKKEDIFPLPDWYKNKVKKISSVLHGKEEGTRTEKTLTWIGKTSIHFGKWTKNLSRLDFGLSSKDKRPVLKRIGEALPITLSLNIIAILIVYFVSVPLGIWSALRKDTLIDKVVMVKLFLLYSLPEFWVATLLLVFLAGGDYLNLFPLVGFASDGAEHFPWYRWILDVAWHLVLPITVYVYGSFAFLSRFVRNNFLDVIRDDYIRTARAKGLPEKTVIWKHAFRNSLIPLVTLMGTLLPGLLGGSVIVEQIFSIPGMGMLSFEAVLGRDYNVIMGIATISTFLTLVSLLLSDLLYVAVDPRISLEGNR